MRSGWPHTQDDHGTLQAEQRQAFGPDISWPTGYSGLEYRDGDYRYPAQSGAQPYVAQPPAPTGPAGEHPYAAFGNVGYDASSGGYPQPNIDDFGYGDPGYSHPGYDGPASEDAGIPGTQTVSGFVESRHTDSSYRQSARSGQQSPYALPAPPAGLAAPQGQADYQRSDVYQQPWNYDQPLRYDGEEPSRPGRGDYGQTSYSPSPYDPADYNGSEYSMPGINGPGYDLSGIIGTGEFPEIGYDQPSYGRLSYDDPRYDDSPRYNTPTLGEGPRHTETRFDMPALDDSPRHDQTRFDMPALNDFGGTRLDLDHVWPAEENSRRRMDDTRMDLGLGLDQPPLNQTRFDMPALGDFQGGPRFDETSIDGMRALAPATEFRPAGTGLLAPPVEQPLSWADETSIDTFGDMDEVPAAFTRTLEREAPAETPEEAAARRASTGKRRGRSSDKRQWMALGAIAIVAAGAIGAVLMKFNSGPGGPAHTVSAPNQVSSFTREPNLEQQMKVNQLAAETVKSTAGQASDVTARVYQWGSSAPGSNPQIFMFVGGKLANSNPAESVANFEQHYKGAKAVSPGSLGGDAACAEAPGQNGESVAMCVWFDNDTFGELVSPTMNASHLASTLDSVRPDLEHLTQS
jgi:hypothetical protein